MKYLHVDCLKEWLKNRLIARHTEQSLYYFWKSLDCELCKATLPSTVTVRGLTYSLMTLVSPDTPFIILESFKRENSVNRGVHLIKFLDMSPVMVGRGNESDVRISQDISVSRCHATIKLVKDGLLFEDQGSKFGTLLQRSSLMISPGDSVTIQVSRSTLEFRNPVAWSFKSFCAKLCCRASKVRHRTSSSVQDDALSELSAFSTSRPLHSAPHFPPELFAQVSRFTSENLPLNSEPLHESQQFTFRECDLPSISVKVQRRLSHRELSCFVESPCAAVEALHKSI
jgi:hypothetical protein